MPRLVGKRSNSGFLWSFAVLAVAIAGFGTLEYKGYTDFVPEIGPQLRPAAAGSAEPASPRPAAGGSTEPPPL